MKRIFSICFFIVLSIQSYALNYYWVGGEGKWSDYANHWATTSGGTTFHSQVPTNLDDVFFDQNSTTSSFSYTVSVDQTIVYCRNMDWTGVRDYTQFKSTFLNNTLKIFGSLKLTSTMQFYFDTNIYFEATTSGNTISCMGQELKAIQIQFNGINGEWTLNDTFSAKHEVFHNAGTIHTNDFTMNIGGYFAEGTAASNFDIGSSTINVEPGSYSFSGLTEAWSILNSSLVFDPSQSTINFLGVGNLSFTSITYNYNIINSGQGMLDFDCKECTVKEMNFKASANIKGNSTFQKLLFTEGNVYTITGDIKIPDSGSLIAMGTCSKPIFIQADRSANRSAVYTLKKNTGAVNVEYVYLENAATSGTASFDAANSYNLGNVTGWNIALPTSKNLYWVGGGGNWSDQNHWSLTSGGAVISGCVPTYADNVFFDQNSGLATNAIVKLDLYKAQCKNMDWSAITNNVTLDNNRNKLYISGSLTLSAKLQFSVTTGQLIFNSQSTGNTIKTAGVLIPGQVILDGIGGEWTLVDAFSVGDIGFYNGSLISNNQQITTATFSAMPDKVNSIKIVLQNSTVKLTGAVWYMTAGIGFQCGTSTIIINNTTSSQTLNASLYNFYNINALGLNVSISATNTRKLYFALDGSLEGNQSFDSLIFSAGHKYTLTNATYTINKDFIAKGTCGNYISITGSSYYKTKIIKSSGSVLCTNLMLSDVDASGGATFSASNSVALTAITGWTLLPSKPRNLYWIGGAGDWKDPSHWSLSDGGTGGECEPNRFDNVYFTQSSGLNSGKMVKSTVASEFHNMDWSGIIQVCNLTSYDANCYGSLILSSSVTVSMSITFRSSTPETIKTAAKTIGSVTFDGTGSWKLLDNLKVGGGIKHIQGTFITNGYSVNLGTSYNVIGNATLDIRNSKMSIAKGGFFGMAPYLVLLATKSEIEFLNQDPVFYPAGINYSPSVSFSETSDGLSFGRVICRNNAARFIVSRGQHSFTYFLAEGGAEITNSCSYDTLSLTPGRTYIFAAGSTQTVRSVFNAIGQPGFPIEILSKSVGTSVDISKASGIVCAEYLYLKDIHAVGGATFYAGANGANVANNTGWIFTDCGSNPPVTTSVSQRSNLSDIMLYPVPANDALTIYIPDAGTYNLKMYNMQSVEVLNRKVEGGSDYHLNTSAYIAGTYYMSIDNGTSQKTIKIVIVH
ncbi:T9SS type A sorting domain-containing protein [Cytophaga aurantiaca]|uniref:T9SS type A sorting domain-containing protein n=1 Tax=Cytophaga aurantiaca TaxID=29530 RepID=UPI00036EF0A4|nr:T9SS type A sorting domain-containing protein [Cytophaga aurantiaca]